MASLAKFETEPRTQLLSEIKGARCVMLGSPNESELPQPMAPQIDESMIERAAGDAVIYFFSDNTSDLGKAVLANPGATVTATHIDTDYQAALRGSIREATTPELVERFWNPIAASWYPGGKDDPKLIMLEFRPETAAIWASSGNPLKFLYETAKANLTDTLPDVGKSKVVTV